MTNSLKCIHFCQVYIYNILNCNIGYKINLKVGLRLKQLQASNYHKIEWWKKNFLLHY